MTARSTCNHLIAELRMMGDVTTSDFTVGVTTWWSDAHLQDVLDRNREYINYAYVEPIPSVAPSGTYTYTLYPSMRENWEDGVVVQDQEGGTIGTAAYTIDLATGLLTFGTNTAGSARYVTGYTYNLNAAAADVWDKKAARYASRYDVSTDNHSLKRSQMVAQAREQARYFRDLSMVGYSITLDRTD